MSVNFVYAITLINSVGIFASQVVLSLFALKLGAGPFAVGAIAGTFGVFPMLLAIRAGRLIDRFGSRWPMLIGAAAGGAGMLVPFVLPGLPSLFVAALSGGFAIIFVSLATQNLVGLMSAPETRPRNFSVYTLVMSISNFLGPLAGGFSIDHAGHANTCLIISLLSLAQIALLAIWGGRLPGSTRRARKSGGGGVRAMLADPVVRRTLINGSLVNIGIILYQVYMPVYGHSIGLSASAIGLVLGMNSAAAFVVRFALPRLVRRYGEQRLLVAAFAAGATSLASIPLLHAPVLLGMASFVFGIGMGAGQPIVLMLMYSSSPDGRSGEALGLKVMTNQLTKMVTPVLFGAVASAFGLPPIFWINAVVLALGGAVGARDLSKPPPTSAGPPA